MCVFGVCCVRGPLQRCKCECVSGVLAPVSSHRSLVDVRSGARHHVHHIHTALLGRPVERRLQHTHADTAAVNHHTAVNHHACDVRLALEEQR